MAVVEVAFFSCQRSGCDEDAGWRENFGDRPGGGAWSEAVRARAALCRLSLHGCCSAFFAGEGSMLQQARHHRTATALALALTAVMNR